MSKPLGGKVLGLLDAVDDVLVEPLVSRHVPQMQKKQPKALRFAGIGQANQQIGDPFILIAQK